MNNNTELEIRGNFRDQGFLLSPNERSQNETNLVADLVIRRRNPSSVDNWRDIIIVVAYDVCDAEESSILRRFIKIFGINIYKKWSIKTTHVIVQTDESEHCNRSDCYMKALLSNCVIVTIDWIIDCLQAMSLLHEINYIPLDEAPMVAWRMRHNMINSPLNWAKDVILYFHKSVYINYMQSDIIWCSKTAGFEIILNLQEFRKDSNFKTHIILIDYTTGYQLPTYTNATNWITEYDATVTSIDWLINCFFRYQFVDCTTILPRK